ncbi:putative pectinesterase 14 [Cardamine amara subsp. amara]|uniref:Pectinesterase 14 n=1 Tax=Cardamine amara subsp. amara TaxID=228776 RepID=A0ABD1C4J0_CARAN
MYQIQFVDQRIHHPPKCDHFSSFPNKGYSLVLKVSLEGCGSFTKIQDAIDASNISSPTKTLIIVDYGIYNFVMQGMGYSITSIEWNSTYTSSNGTSESLSVAVLADNFTAYNISFKVFVLWFT